MYRGVAVDIFIIDGTIDYGTYNWTIPSSQTEAENYRIKVIDSGNSSVYDYSDSYFTIGEAGTPTITVITPNGGESWEPGSSHTITWASSSLSGNLVDIRLYRGIAVDIFIINGIIHYY